ncbi:glycosyl transferase [Saccharopolyspora subtropica]|uniref:Glycosyl transferase n=1 Tax=Saccharopolyspora thermophila TaxID=89367 RepID=A0A917NIU0_9PSEU|nr:glycosyltransferase [Saccharopolyspora subtropica]GGJ03833.1 glycosyl transferase [Saccharopolyspora subtropica]
MRVLLSTIGSRGEVQPVAALASRLQALGQDVRVCVSPDFCDWIEDLGIPAIPLGPAMRPAATSGERSWDLSSPEGRRRAAADAVAAQFATLPEAARGCEVLVACGAVLVAGRSVAELVGAGYVHVHYCPATVPSPHHAPAPWPGWPQDETGPHRQRWAWDARRWNDTWGPALNAHRARAGLAPVEDVRSHVLGDQPLLAADPVLGPWPEPDDPAVRQTGAWILPDKRPLPPELAAFLDAGEPPVYFGLGSMRSPHEDVSRVLVDAARALGRRVIISRGWANLPLPDKGDDCLLVGEVNHQALFRRVAAVVHHGGAGTTTAAAKAGAAQVVLPQVYDQHYWARRVDHLGIGVAHPRGVPTVDSLTGALSRALAPDVAARARDVATTIRTDGTRVAAQHLLDPQLRPSRESRP